jgi:hypothetical protein
MIGKLIGKIVAAPIKAVVSLPEVAADMVDELGKAIDPSPKEKK